MNKKITRFGLTIFFSTLIIVLTIMGQNNNQQTKLRNVNSRPDTNPVLAARFEKIIKNQEKRFIGTRAYINKDDIGSNAGLYWKLHEDYVEVRVRDFYSLQDALDEMSMITNPMKRSVSVKLTKLTNLGDDAYFVIHSKNRRSPETEMGVRKGNVVLYITSTKEANPNWICKFIDDVKQRPKTLCFFVINKTINN
jgi:hypothetical protein